MTVTKSRCPQGHNGCAAIFPSDPDRVRCREADRLTKMAYRLKRGMSLDGRRSRYSLRCKRGHRLSGDNVYIQPSTGRRRCRTCNNVRRLRLGRAS